MSGVEERLAEVYGAASQNELSKTYDQWASDYDAQMLSIGYAHPAVIVGLTSRYVPALNTSILDAGVGTGTIGQLLHTVGFTNLHGIDMSPGMLARAKARGIYTGLHRGVLGEEFDFNSASFGCIVSTGTFTTGHAPASAFDELTRILKPGGHLIFTVGTNVWSENGFEEKLENLQAQGLINPVWQSAPYRPMPFSKTESHFETRAHVFQRA